MCPNVTKLHIGSRKHVVLSMIFRLEMDSTDEKKTISSKNIQDNVGADIAESDDPTVLKRKTYKNLIAVSLGFLFTFTAFQALQNLQSSIHSDESLGLGSLISVYVSLLLSCMFVPPILIGKLGAKYTIMVSMSGYVLYTLSMFYPRYGTLIPASIILGNNYNIYRLVLLFTF